MHLVGSLQSACGIKGRKVSPLPAVENGRCISQCWAAKGPDPASAGTPPLPLAAQAGESAPQKRAEFSLRHQLLCAPSLLPAPGTRDVRNQERSPLLNKDVYH